MYAGVSAVGLPFAAGLCGGFFDREGICSIDVLKTYGIFPGSLEEF
jgi:hypothetical protein